MFSFGSSFYIKKHFNRRKIHSGLFLSYTITGIDVNDIIRYPSSQLKSLKYHLTSIFTVFKKKQEMLQYETKAPEGPL